MKILFLTLVLTIFSVLPVSADLVLTSSFTMTMSGDIPAFIPEAMRRMESLNVIKIKGDKVSIHGMPDAKNVLIDMTSIHDLRTGDTTHLDHVNKIYWVESREDKERLAAMTQKTMQMQMGPIPKQRPEARPTGRKTEIKGYAVEEFVATIGASQQHTYWIARDLAKHVAVVATQLTATSGPSGAMAALWYPDPAMFPGLAIKSIVETHANGMINLGVTVLESIREVTLDDADFAVPDGYARSKGPKAPIRR